MLLSSYSNIPEDSRLTWVFLEAGEDRLGDFFYRHPGEKLQEAELRPSGVGKMAMC